MRTGGKTVLIPNPRDLKATLKELSSTVSQLPAVNTLFNGLANHPDFDTVDWSHLKVSVGGGMAVQRRGRAVAQEDRLPHLRGYGLSETSPRSPATRSRPRLTRAPSACPCPAPM
jgi:long-chain acyl-CoA synthetase